MQDIASGVSIDVLSETLFKVVLVDPYTTLILEPPEILNDLNETIGISTIVSDLTYSITFSEHEYPGNVTVRIPARTIIADFINTNFIDIDSVPRPRDLPIINYTFPPNTNDIGFKTGITLCIDTTNLPTGIIPLNITTTVPLTFKDNTENIFYDGGFLYFVTPEVFTTHTEKITLLPEGATASLGETITIDVPVSTAVTQTPETIIYNIQSIFTPLSASSLQQKMYMYIYPNGDLLKPNVMKLWDILEIISDDCTPTFSLNTASTEFAITPEGILTKDPSVILPAEYILDINVTDDFGGSIDISLTICVINVLTPTYLETIIIDFCRQGPDRCISSGLIMYCPGDDEKCFSLNYGKIRTLREVSSLILQNISFIIQYTTYIDFNTLDTDIIPMAVALIRGNLIEYIAVIKNHFPLLVPGSRLDQKLDLFIEETYNFFYRVMQYYICPLSFNGEIYHLASDCFKYGLKICQR